MLFSDSHSVCFGNAPHGSSNISSLENLLNAEEKGKWLSCSNITIMRGMHAKYHAMNTKLNAASA